MYSFAHVRMYVCTYSAAHTYIVFQTCMAQRPLWQESHVRQMRLLDYQGNFLAS